MLSFFPRGVLDQILNLIDSISEDFPSYSFNSTSRYLDDLLNIDNTLFDSMVNHIYPSELQLHKANVSNTEASFLDLPLTYKRDDFDLDIVNFSFLDGDVPRSTSYGV